MDSHSTWWNLLPGYDNLQALLQTNVVYGETHEIVAQHIFGAALVALFLLVGALSGSRVFRAGPVPAKRFGLAAIFDAVLGVAAGLCKDIIGGHEWKRYFPLIATLGLFILFSNLLGLIPGFAPPTDNLETTAVCGVIVFLYYNFHGFRVNGIKVLTHMANPMGVWWGWFLAPLMFPVELVGHLARPLSLALRLRGNMFGDHMVIALFAGILPIVLPMPFLMLGTLVCMIQAFVFCVLSCVYISMAVAHDDH
jgi:F-type H+-transporting ATPase subunit a